MFHYKIEKYIAIVFIHMGGDHGTDLIDFKRHEESSGDVLNFYQQFFSLYNAKNDKIPLLP